MSSTEVIERELSRQRRAREEAERLLEFKSAELHAANQRLRRLYDHAADAIFVHDGTGNIVDVNRAACDQLGYSRDQLLSMSVQDFELFSTEELTNRRRNFSLDLPIRIDGIHRKSDGTEVPVEVHISQIEQTPEPLFLAIARDVSLRIRQRQQLEATRARLRRLSSEVTLTEAKERHRLAHVLHDTIGHDLAVVRMHVKKLGKTADVEKEKMHAECAAKLIEDVVKQVRQVTFDLSPATLFELGLPAAVKVIARVASQEHEADCRVVSSGDWKTVPTDLAILLFYATRELIHNALKHAHASQINIQLDRLDHAISIAVSDDGIGFIPENAGQDDESTTFGLFSIRERLASLGGDLRTVSELQIGTKMSMWLPCSNQIEAQSK